MNPLPVSKRRRSLTASDGIVPGGALHVAAAPVTAALLWISPRTWRTIANLVLWLVMTYVVALITVAGVLASLLTVWVLGLGVVVRASVVRLLAMVVRVDRERIERISGVRVRQLALAPADPDLPWLDRQRVVAQAGLLWRMPAYELICLPLVTALALAAATWWWATIACFALAVRRSELMYQSVSVLGIRVGEWYLSSSAAIGLVVGGVAAVVVWPSTLRLVTGADVTLARWLLGPSTSDLTREVARLSETRTRAVAAAADERRRIERDLHDGFQPQLVNLALNLGLARSRLATDPESVGELLDRAHQDAKRATEDLRNLVRGIHPSVLDERGLDAAFSALAASSSVPLQIDVHLERRPPREVEGIAYFLVAEAITNVSKHAGAQTATVTVSEADGSLWVLVQDDGHGGASTEPGGGLAGLAARIAGVDGTFTVTSPEGGPTWIEALIPCAR